MLKLSTSPLPKQHARVFPKRLASSNRSAPRTLWVEGDQYQAARGGCPSCQRALLLLELKGLPYNLAFVDQRKPVRWLREVSATGQVPVLNDGGQWIAEASAIAKHLDTEYQPPPGARVLNPCPEIPLVSYLRAYLSSTGSSTLSTGVSLRMQLAEVEAYLTAARPYRSGSELCASDALLIPGLQHIDVSVPLFKRVDILEEFPMIREFLEAASKSAAVQKSNCGSAAIIGYWLGQGIPRSCSRQDHSSLFVHTSAK